MAKYAFDNAWEQARQRLATIEAWLDPGTIRHLSVLATDLDTCFVEAVAIDRPNLECLRHDAAADELPIGAFDLAHTRLVLGHLPERATALDWLVGALKPGGWLVVEEMDFLSVAVDPRCGAENVTLFMKGVAAHHRVVMGRGFDVYCGRRVLGDLRARGLGKIGTEGRVFCWGGGSAGAAAWWLTFEQLGEQMVASGEITAEELAAVIPLCDDPGFAFLSQATIVASGQRPVA